MMGSILLLKTKQGNYGLVQAAEPVFMMERNLLFSEIKTVIPLVVFGRSSKIEKAISGSVEVMAFGVMTATCLPISL